MDKHQEKPLSTAEVLTKFAIGRNTLRLYEKMGLLTRVARTGSGYRKFQASQIEELRFILEAKKVGFALGEIKDLLEVFRASRTLTCGKVSVEISEKLQEIDQRMKSLLAQKTFLADFLNVCGSKRKDEICDLLAVGFSKKACC